MGKIHVIPERTFPEVRSDSDLWPAWPDLLNDRIVIGHRGHPNCEVCAAQGDETCLPGRNPLKYTYTAAYINIHFVYILFFKKTLPPFLKISFRSVVIRRHLSGRVADYSVVDFPYRTYIVGSMTVYDILCRSVHIEYPGVAKKNTHTPSEPIL